MAEIELDELPTLSLRSVLFRGLVVVVEMMLVRERRRYIPGRHFTLQDSGVKSFVNQVTFCVIYHWERPL